MTKKRATLARTALFFFAFCLFVVPTALGSWAATGGGAAGAKSLVMPQGATPTGSATGADVLVSWSAVTVGGAAVAYSVRRFDASSGVPATVGSGCSGAVTATTCTESGVAAGTWRYAVTPVVGGWIGAESDRSASVLATCSFTPSRVRETANSRGPRRRTRARSQPRRGVRFPRRSTP